MPVKRTSALALLLATLLGAPASAAEEAEPMEVEELAATWRRVTAGPIAAVDLPGGWTGTELVVADPDQKRRAASYLPRLDRWSDLARPPRKVMAGSATHWTGSELVFVEPRGTARRGLVAYDPVSDAWRTTAASPINEIADAVWADAVLVAISVARSRAAAYDPLTDTWAELPPLEGATPLSLHLAGDDVWVLASLAGDGALAFVPLDLESGSWGEPLVGPLTPGTAEPVWMDDAFVFLTPRDDMPRDDMPRDDDEADRGVGSPDARFEPSTGTWSTIENPCRLESTGAVWTGSHLLSLERRTGWEPAAERCLTPPRSPWPERTGALRVWTGEEILAVGGDTGGRQPRRDGVAFDPFPDDESPVVRLDKGSRPVRVRVPSLGIDLPIVWDGRKIPGGSPGYPACDVAEYWSAFGEPGAPGTAWILAHAQQGMFLPLLTTLRSEGREALLGRTVEVQLRDGRLLTYRTYRVDPSATDTRIATRKLKDGEHRLVLQTSTGVGPAPKLLVAARLVDATTTDEPRPKPDPRACG